MSCGLSITAQLLDHSLNGVYRRLRPARLSSEHFAALVDDEDAARGALRCFLESDRADERRTRVAKQRVGQALLGLERRVGFGAVGREAVYAQASGG